MEMNTHTQLCLHDCILATRLMHRAVHIGRDVLARICMHSCAHTNMNNMNTHVGEWDGEGGKQVGSMNEESQLRGCHNITFICTPTRKQCRLSPEINT